MQKSIYIDATHFQVSKPTGVEVYTTALILPLVKLLIEADYRVYLISHQEYKPPALTEFTNVEWIYSKHRPFWSQTTLLKILKKARPSLYFTPSGVPPLTYRGKTAIAVHDLAVYQIPKAFSYGQRQRLTWMSKRAAIHAGLILTPSKHTKFLVKNIWRIPEEKIKVVPLAYEVRNVEVEKVEGVEADPFFLYLGRIETKKNLLPMIKGFRKVAGERPVQLVLAGMDGLGSKEVHHLIRSFPQSISERIIMPGFISDGQKEWLLSRAKALVAPCPHEGFGLPVLEAFAHKLPVIAAQAGSLVEVGQDAAVYAQADIATDWSIQMQRILEDQYLARTCIERGEKYLANYSWEKTARLTAEYFQNYLEVGIS